LNANETPGRLPSSLIAVLLVGLPLTIVSESAHPGYYAKLLLLHAGLVGMAVFAATQRKRQLLGSSILLPAILFVLLNILATTQSVNRVASLVIIAHRIGLLATFILATSLVDRRSLSGLVTVIGLTSGLTAAIGISQYAGLAGLDLPSSGMPSATFGYRNFAAAYIIASLPFVAWEITRRTTIQSRLIWAGLLFLNSTYLIATRTRAAWGACALSLLVGLAMYAWRARQPSQPKPHRLKEACAIVAGTLAVSLAFSVLLPPNMGGRGRGFDAHSQEKTSVGASIVSTFEPGADKGRFVMWRNSLDMLGEYPIAGVGPGNWQFLYPKFDRGDISWKGATPQRPHNDYIWIATETGIPGLLVLIWLMITTTGSIIRALRKARDQIGVAHIIASSTSLVAVAAHSFFSFPLERIPVTFMATIALSIVVLYDPQSSRRSASHHTGIIWWCLAAVTTLSATTAWRAIQFDKMAYRQQGAVQTEDWSRSIQHATEAVKMGMFDPQVLLLRGLAHHVTGHYDPAIADQETCLTYHPYLVNAMNNMGMSLNAAGRHRDAIAVLSRIAKLNPEHVEGHLNLSRSYDGLSDTTAALRELTLAHEKDPKRTDILSELGRRYEREGNLVQAAEMATRAVQLKPDRDGLHYRLGVIRQKQGQLKDAATSFRTVLQLNRNHVPVLYNLGELYLSLSDTTKAVQAYEAFLSRWTGGPEAAEPVRRKLESLR
jgi:O-antigen ligase/Flp pilus assembly protein TadD